MKLTTMICAAAVAVCGTLSAQSASSVDRVAVHFSTPVQVGSITLPAGDCSISVLRGSSDNLVLALRSESGVSVSVLVNRLNDPIGTAQTEKDPQVVLSRHGDQYRFERILMPDHSGFEVLPSAE